MKSSEMMRDIDAICKASTHLEMLELTEGRALRYATQLERALWRLRRLRAQMLIWKLTQRIDTAHSANCKRPLLRIANAKARLERVRRMVGQ